MKQLPPISLKMAAYWGWTVLKTAVESWGLGESTRHYKVYSGSGDTMYDISKKEKFFVITSRRRMFPATAFLVLQNFHQCFSNSIKKKQNKTKEQNKTKQTKKQTKSG